MKHVSRDLALALILVLGVLGALMASPSSSNLVLGATTCGVNGCVSTPPLSSTTSYQYTSTSTSATTSTTTSTTSTNFVSTTTITPATSTFTSFSASSTISTTITTTSYSSVITATQTSTNTAIATLVSTSTTGSTYTNMVTVKGTSTSCPVSFATSGTSLQPYADFLRGFRNNDIQNTTAGREFMLTFNTWYYSWAPSLSYSAASNPLVFRAVQAGVYPLIGILYASYYTYTFISPISTEAAAITAGIVAASLLGVIFVAPVAYVTLRIFRRHGRLALSKQIAGPSILWFTGSVLVCLVGYATGSGQMLAVATSSIAVSGLTLGSLLGMRTLACVQVPIVNYVGMVFSFKRLARTLFL